MNPVATLWTRYHLQYHGKSVRIVRSDLALRGDRGSLTKLAEVHRRLCGHKANRNSRVFAEGPGGYRSREGAQNRLGVDRACPPVNHWLLSVEGRRVTCPVAPYQDESIKSATGRNACRGHYHSAKSRLDTFPSKIIELNDIIVKYMPDSARAGNACKSARRQTTRSPSTLSTIRDYDLTTIPEFDVTSYYSLSMRDRSCSRRGIFKKKRYRIQNLRSSTGRRRPGPLGQFLAFVFGRLAICTRRIIVAPSRFLVDNIMSMMSSRLWLKDAQFGSRNVENWSSSLSTYVITAKAEDTVIGNFINRLRPAAIQLISDTTILKRWLQAVALDIVKSLPTELVNATRTTETIDCWAYELYFHLKYLQVNHARPANDKAAATTKKIDEDVTYLNLWHRMVQLRDNYIILYEGLHNCPTIRDIRLTKQE
ncbi:hypothetical protein KM043_008221 [Ampulex compressa]|nr:hypothetical protein KM043_008221 [Ampulex compressa]